MGILRSTLAFVTANISQLDHIIASDLFFLWSHDTLNQAPSFFLGAGFPFFGFGPEEPPL